MPKARGHNNTLPYALTAIIGMSCCLGQSCSPSSIPVPADNNADPDEQVLGYQPDLPLLSFESFSPLPLIARAGGRQIAQPDTVISLDGSDSADPAGGDLTFAWKQIDGPAVNLLNASASLAMFTAPNVQEATLLRFSLTVGNGSSTASDIAEVEVLPVPLVSMSLVVSAL